MFEVTIIESFSAAHRLADIGGQCEELHGHNFKVEITVGAQNLNEDGLLIDFRLVKQWLGSVLGDMDHQHLNDLPFCEGKNPSSEMIAHYIFTAIQPKAQSQNVRVLRVKVWESDTTAATYEEG